MHVLDYTQLPRVDSFDRSASPMPFVWSGGERRERRRLPRPDSPHDSGDDGDGDCRPSNAGSSCCGVSRLPGVDPGARGLHDHECFRGEDRWLWLCTETLGSESCDMVPEEEAAAERAERTEARRRRRTRAERWRMEKREFPPPLRWLEAPGSRVMRSERRDGRLILTEVRVEQAELLREDGRLRLHLVGPEGEEEEETAAAAERWEWRREAVLSRCNRAAAGGRGEPSRRWDPLFVTGAMAMAKV